MVQNLKIKIIFIIALLLGAAYVLYYKNITLGLDLSGGSSLRYKLPPPEDFSPDEGRTMKDVTADTVAVFRKRIEGYGLKEIPIRVQGDNEILIELPGMSQAEVDDIVNIIQSQGNLEYMLVSEDESDQDDPSIAVDVKAETLKLINHLKKLEEDEGGWDLNTNLSALTFSKTINDESAHYFWLPRSADVVEIEYGFKVEENSTFEGLGVQIDSNSDLIQHFFLLMKRYDNENWRFHGQDLSRVSPSRDQNQNPAVGFEFNSNKAGHFGDFTDEHTNKRLAIVLDGKVSSDPKIHTAIRGPGTISGPQPQGFTLREQKALLTILRSGSVEVKPVLMSQNTIGPTLGENSIYRGKIAAVIGLTAVFAFMVIYYMTAGLIASLSLAVNLIFLMGVLIFLEATLTLPGIAGIVLTVGMAVDANILIFERIREEKDRGKTIAQSIKNGFERAFITIVDANVTTFITGFILFQFGTGPIKGFAATLMIGICSSLFAALVVSKVVFALLLDKGVIKKNLAMLRLLKSPNISFIKGMPPAGICSLIIVVVGLAGFVVADQSKYGLDFTGGYNVHLKCVEGTSQADIQTILGSEYPNVQVVSIDQGAVKRVEEPFEVFDIKIKSTMSVKEALLAEEEALKAAGGAAAEPESDVSSAAQGPVGSSAVYLKKIKELLKGKLVKDPIFDLSLHPDEATQTTMVDFGLNLAEPTDEAGLKSAFGDLLEIKEAKFSDDNKSVLVKAVYPVGTTFTPMWIQGRISTTLKKASKAGSQVELLDPFPLTGYIGPTVGHQLRDAAVIAIFFSLVAIIVYIRLRFKQYKYGLAAAAALVHDVLITLGAVTAARATGLVDVEIDLPLIAAFLTIIGYSLNDTIVVFDRVRENLPRVSMPFPDLVNLSINQTLSRTVLTSLTTLMAVVLLFVLNYGQRNVMEGFSFALIVGVVVGTYSSIFVASPVLLLLHRREEQQAAVK